jgi:hypothetical protein
MDKGEQLIDLHKLKGMIADPLIQEPGALLAYHFEHG